MKQLNKKTVMETGYNNMKLTTKQVGELIKNSCADSTYQLLIDNGFLKLAKYVKFKHIQKRKSFYDLVVYKPFQIV